MKCDPRVLVVGLESLKVEPTPQTRGDATAQIQLRFADGEKIHLGLTEEALAELCRALIETSPKAPGTPGRN